MSQDRSNGGPPPPVVWENPEIRGALARHDLARVFGFLSSRGFSQRRIGALTGQSQSEISEICGGRKVMSYEVLERIADGLGIPRGYMGLGWSPADPQTPLELVMTAGITGPREAEEVRQVLAHAAEVTMGVSVPETSRWWQPVPRTLTPVPGRVSDTDAAQVEHITRVLRALDYQHGGGACRESVVAQANYVRTLLTANCTDRVRRRLQLALADLHNLAGWTSFDVGLFSAAREHFGRSLEQAKACEEPSLVANVLYRLGRVHLHQQYTSQALRFFQLGQLAAQDADDPLTVAMLHANEAWAHALMGSEKRALNALGRAQEEFAHGRDSGSPGWVSFFGVADLHALMGIVHGLLPTKGHVDNAVKNLRCSIGQRENSMARSTIFELTALATVRLDTGDVEAGIADGHRAVDLADTVRSVRTVDRLAPLKAAAEEHPDDGAAALVQRIVILRGG